ncbi:beta-1,6-N-acetylglucosaminyltransferase [Sphingomonas sp. NPDC079357]|uniref:beta-1,6-N-acetylglucosaminyltransferase n=1 Tax=Sphingomonas sp. NPDC079357 TaxID=3364518 RepID=UPI00384A7E91
MILSHRDPAQLLRLVGTLNRLYDDPPIACHHDHAQCPIDVSAFPGNVRFVEPSIRTGWAKWSVVRGFFAALRLLYDHAAPDWFVLMSASDYPIRRAEAVRDELVKLGADALIDYRQIGDTADSATARFGPRNPELDQFESDGNRRLKRSHYEGAEIWLPMLRFNDGGRRVRPGRFTVHLPFATPFGPFSRSFPCFYGDHWFTGNARVARLLLHPTPQHLKLQQHLTMRSCPDECYFQTVLCNEPDLTLVRDNRRYAQWNGGGAHPQLLTEGDLGAICASNGHFARKFAHGAPVLDRIDAMLFD